MNAQIPVGLAEGRCACACEREKDRERVTGRVFCHTVVQDKDYE